jgi:hypothetical protein
LTENCRDRVIYDMYAHPFDDEWQCLHSPFCELDRLHLRGNFEGYRLVKGPKQLLIVGAQTFAETQGLFTS